MEKKKSSPEPKHTRAFLPVFLVHRGKDEEKKFDCNSCIESIEH